MRISLAAIDALKPGENIWDSSVPGLGVRRSKGGAASWVLRYRTKDRVQREQTIARTDVLKPDQARDRARKLLVRVADGEDPIKQARARQNAPTIAELAELFMKEHLPKKAENTRISYEVLFRVHVVPKLGKLRVHELDEADVADFLEKYPPGRKQGSKAIRVLSKAYNHATKRAKHWGWARIERNPCRGAELQPDAMVKRYLTKDESERLGRALLDFESIDPIRWRFVRLVRLILYTGARVSEWKDARWEWVDFDAGELRLPPDAHKTGADMGTKTIILTPATLDVLRELRRASNGEFVLQGRYGDAPLVGYHYLWVELLGLAGIQGLRVHDLRHSFASIAVSQGLSLPQIGGLMGHLSPSTTARYAHLVDDAKRAAAALVTQAAAGALANVTNCEKSHG